VINITNEERTRSAQLLSAFLGEGERAPIVDPDDIIPTDDIGECRPFNELVGQVTGEASTRIARRLPFERYEQFDSSRLDHVFRITTVHKDVTAVQPEIEKFKNFYEISQYLVNEHQMIIQAALATNSDQPTRMKPSALLTFLKRKIEDANTELQRERVQNVSVLTQVRTTLDQLITRATALEATTSIRITFSAGGSNILHPCPGQPISSRYNEPRSRGRIHGALDFSGARGTPILAAAGGIVTAAVTGELECGRSDWGVYRSGAIGFWDVNGNAIPRSRALGNMIEVTHSQIGLVTRYCHLDTLRVSKESTVEPGQIIGTMGHTGWSTNYHLHFAVLRSGVPIDPEPLIGSSGNADGSGRFSVEAAMANGASFVTSYRQMLTQLMSAVETVHQGILARLTSAINTTYVNDISGKAEEIMINWSPGTNVSVPIEGEAAPVVQSMGGRRVDITLKLKEQSPIDVAKIALMFKVSNNHETIAGMLTLARSAFKAGISVRHEYIQRFYRAEQIQRFISGMTGGAQAVKLDEPVMVENEYLNALGLKTFHPTSLEIRTVEEAAEAYEIMLTLTYLNLGNRNIEGLLKPKYGTNVPLLPIAVRLGMEDGQSGYGLDQAYKFYHLLARIAVRDAMAEFLPLYCMYKVYRSYLAIEKLIGEQPNVDIAEVDTASADMIMASLLPANMHDQFRSTISTTRDPGTTTEQYVGYLSRDLNQGSGVLALGVSVYAGMERIMGRVMSRGSKWALIVGGGLLVGTTALRSVYGSMGTPENNADSDTVYVNIPSIMPLMMWSLLGEWVDKIASGKESEFVSEIVSTVMDMLSVSTAINGKDRRFRFTKPVRLNNLDPVGGSRLVRELHLSMIVSGVHQEESSPGFLMDTEIRSGLSTIDSSTSESRRGREQLVNKMKNGSERQKLDAMLAYAAAEINWMVIDCIKLIQTISNGMAAGEGGNIGTFFHTASEIYRNGASRRYVVEVMTSLFTVTFMDRLAAQFVLSNGRQAQYGYSESISFGINRGLSSLSREDLCLALTEAIGSRFQNDIASARRVAQSRGMNVEVLSGVFADGSFMGSPEVRRGFAAALSVLTGSVIPVAMGTTRAGDPGHGMLLEKYTTRKIIHILERSSREIALEQFVDLFEYLSQAVVNFLPSLALTIGAAIASYGWSLVLNIIDWVISIATIVPTILDAFGNSVRLVMGHGSLFALSKWCAGRISESMDRTQLLECCYVSGIWMPSALSFGGDASDDIGTSYMDFPVVEAGGKPMPPDFFIYKVGLTQQAYEQMRTFMEEMTGLVSSRYGDLTGEDITNLRAQLIQDIGQAQNRGIQVLQENLLRIMNANKPANAALQGAYFNALGKSGNCIDLAVYDSARIASNIGGICSTSYGSARSSIRADHCMVNISFSGSQVTVAIGTEFRAIMIKDEFLNAMQRRGTIASRTVEAANLCDDVQIRRNLQSFLQSAVPAILEFIDAQRAISGDFVHGLRNMPGTLGNLLMLKSIVGSNMRAIGQPGLALFSNEVSKIGHNTLRRASTLQTQYFFPTIKLYFIEEDDENWFLFDDLYSYASIVSVSVNMDKYSPMHTANITITNLSGALNDVMSDALNKELNFLRGPDENSPLNSIMLRPGCKIKLQMGNTPILSEEDTVFTGRITSIDFGVITNIVASGHGDMFLEDLSKDSVKIYGDPGSATGNLFGRLIHDAVRDAIRKGMENYLTPLTKLKHVISYVLNDVVQSSERLTDFSIRPPIVAQDPELTPATTGLMNVIRQHFYAGSAESFMSLIGGARTDVHVNYQLFENVNIRNDLVDTNWAGVGTLVTEGFWLSRNETAWDIMNEINLLLPNHQLTVRPYDTRATLVWTDREGYYRYRRTIELDNIMTHSVVSKLIPMIRDPHFKGVQVLQMIASMLSGQNPRKKAGGIAMLVYLAYISQRIYGSFMIDAPADCRQLIPDGQLIKLTGEEGNLTTDEAITRALSWTPVMMLDHMAALTQQMITVYEKIADENETDTFSKDGVSGLRIKDISPWGLVEGMPWWPSLIRSRKPALVVYLLSLNFAAEHVLSFMHDMAASRSKSHRKASDFHIKMSGRDIVKNDIQLMEPYNTVKIIFPKRETDDVEKLVKEAMLGGSSETANELMVPLHYKLKPWSQKTYQTYFKNANAFPTARIQAICTASSSILANLMAQTYGGTITILGDSRIKEGDRILIWDENRDLFGVIGVRSHTMVLDPKSGYLSVIEPEMITRNDGKFQSTRFDEIVSSTDLIVDTLIFASMVVGGIALIQGARKRISMRARGGMITAGLLGRYARGLAQSMGNLVRNIPGARLFARSSFGWFNGLREGKIATDVAKAYAELGTTMASMFTARSFTTYVITDIRQGLGRISRSIGGRQSGQVVRFFSHNLTDRQYTSILNNAFDDTMRELSRATRIGGSGGFRFSTRYADNVIARLRAQLNRSTIQLNETQFQTIATHVRESITRSQFRSWMSQDVVDPFGRGSFENLNARIRSLMNRVTQARVNATAHIGSLDPSTYPSSITSMIANRRGMSNPRQHALNIANKIMDGYRDECMFRSSRILRFMRNNARLVIGGGIALMTAGSLYSIGKQFGELAFLTKYTADRITLAPMMFRGEPFVSGLEGVVKKDGEDSGLADILGARFESTFQGLVHSVSDPYQNALFELTRELERVDRQRRNQ